tara:strand:- start:4220 stop:4519 length:300 start_codon:yes stop_codon:yes gene_type:complete
MDTTPAKLDIDTANLDIQLENHLFTCVKYLNSPDNGFSANLYLLLEAIEHCEGVKDEGIKLIAKGLLQSVMYHKIEKMDMEQVNQRLADWKAKKDAPPN